MAACVGSRVVSGPQHSCLLLLQALGDSPEALGSPFHGAASVCFGSWEDPTQGLLSWVTTSPSSFPIRTDFKELPPRPYWSIKGQWSRHTAQSRPGCQAQHYNCDKAPTPQGLGLRGPAQPGLTSRGRRQWRPQTLGSDHLPTGICAFHAPSFLET